MTPGVILGLGLCLLIVGYILRKMASDGKNVGADLARLVKQVQTEDNKSQIENAVVFHNSRVASGADPNASYERLVRDLRRIGGLDEQTE